MKVFNEEMAANRFYRIPKRVHQDWRIVSLLRNWKQVLYSKLRGQSVEFMQFRNGLVLHSPPQVNLDFLFQEVWLEEIYSPPGFEIEKDDTVIDIGANIGVFAAYAATFASNVNVIAFEPFPENAEWLRKNINDNNLSNVQVFEQAVTGVNEKRKLEISSSWVEHSLNGAIDEAGNTAGKTGQFLSIQCRSFNDVMKNVEKCDLLKIDCEGSEYEIFYHSSTETLNKIKRIVGEFHPRDKHKNNGRALREFLESKNFDVCRFEIFSNETGVFCAKKRDFAD